MNSIQRNISLILLLFTALSLSAQGKKDIVQKGIQVKRIYEQKIDEGEKQTYLEKEEFFNFRGDIVEEKQYSDSGKKISAWFKYKYNQDGELIEEQELNIKGQQKNRTTYKYANGLKTERLTYDERDRLVEKRVYEYDFR